MPGILCFVSRENKSALTCFCVCLYHFMLLQLENCACEIRFASNTFIEVYQYCLAGIWFYTSSSISLTSTVLKLMKVGWYIRFVWFCTDLSVVYPTIQCPSSLDDGYWPRCNAKKKKKKKSNANWVLINQNRALWTCVWFCDLRSNAHFMQRGLYICSPMIKQCVTDNSMHWAY